MSSFQEQKTKLHHWINQTNISCTGTATFLCISGLLSLISPYSTEDINGVQKS